MIISFLCKSPTGGILILKTTPQVDFQLWRHCEDLLHHWLEGRQGTPNCCYLCFVRSNTHGSQKDQKTNLEARNLKHVFLQGQLPKNPTVLFQLGATTTGSCEVLIGHEGRVMGADHIPAAVGGINGRAKHMVFWSKNGNVHNCSFSNKDKLWWYPQQQ